MALTRGYPGVIYRFQGLSLHCWMTALEMLMQWRYGTIYGDDATGAARIAHTPAVVALKARGRGGDITAILDYGLRPIPNPLTTDIDNWRMRLRMGGPILVTGNYGPSRIMNDPISLLADTRVGGHVVLVVGISGSNKVVYMDPFLIGMKAIMSNHYTYQSPDNMVSRMYPVGGGIPQSAMQSADGAADHGINL